MLPKCRVLLVGGQFDAKTSTKGVKVVKLKSESGVIHSPAGKGGVKDFLTWHDQLPYRIWAHSRLSGEGFRPISVEIQWVGKESGRISTAEKLARLDLASMQKGDSAESLLGPSTFRELGIGQIFELHSALVASKRLAQDSQQKPLRAIKDYESEEFTTYWVGTGTGWHFSKEKPSGGILRAKLEDSILIAYVYAEQVASGNKRPSKRTAELFSIEANLVYVAVRNARKKGWLTSDGSGTSGGVLTTEGRKYFESQGGVSEVEKYLLVRTKRGK